MRALLNRVYDSAAALAALFMCAMLVMVLLSIAGREFHFHLRGTDAYAGYCMAASGFLALAHTLLPHLIQGLRSCRALPHRKLHLQKFLSLKAQPMFLRVWSQYWNMHCKNEAFKHSAYGVRYRIMLQPCPTLLPLLLL